MPSGGLWHAYGQGRAATYARRTGAVENALYREPGGPGKQECGGSNRPAALASPNASALGPKIYKTRYFVYFAVSRPSGRLAANRLHVPYATAWPRSRAAPRWLRDRSGCKQNMILLYTFGPRARATRLRRLRVPLVPGGAGGAAGLVRACACGSRRPLAPNCAAPKGPCQGPRRFAALAPRAFPENVLLLRLPPLHKFCHTM